MGAAATMVSVCECMNKLATSGVLYWLPLGMDSRETSDELSCGLSGRCCSIGNGSGRGSWWRPWWAGAGGGPGGHGGAGGLQVGVGCCG